MRNAVFLLSLLLLAACSDGESTIAPPPEPTSLFPSPVKTGAPAGLYELVPESSRIGFAVDYLDNTRVTAQLSRGEAHLQLEPTAPERSSLIVSLDPASVRTNIPGFDDLIVGPDFLDVDKFPKLGFHSTGITLTGAATADVTGDLTLHGVTRPAVLKARFIETPSADAAHPRVRFLAETMLRRSAYDLQASLPLAGDPVGVIDEVKVTIDATFRRVNPTPERIIESRSGKKSPGSPE